MFRQSLDDTCFVFGHGHLLNISTYRKTFVAELSPESSYLLEQWINHILPRLARWNWNKLGREILRYVSGILIYPFQKFCVNRRVLESCLLCCVIHESIKYKHFAQNQYIWVWCNSTLGLAVLGFSRALFRTILMMGDKSFVFYCIASLLCARWTEPRLVQKRN